MSPAPAPPNLPPQLPSAEPVPEANREWATEARDMAALHHVASRIRKNEERKNRYEVEKNNLSHTSRNWHLAEMQAHDIEIQGELDAVFASGDTTTLLDELSFYVRGAKGEYTEGTKLAVQADTKSMGAAQNEAVGFALMRHKQLREGSGTMNFDLANSYAVDTYFKAGSAGRAHEKAANYVQDVTGLATAYEKAMDTQAKKQEMAVNEADLLIKNATVELDNWPIDSHIPGDETKIRDLLSDLDEVLAKKFSPVDTLRAQAQGNYIRLRYRLEQRLINANHSTIATMEEDGGIRLRMTGQPEDDIVIYGDGTTARTENGVDVRRYPIGERAPRFAERRLDATPPTGPLIETDRHGRNVHVTADMAFNDWERTHNEATEVRAYSALNFEISEGNREDAHQTEMLTTLTDRVQAAPDAIREIYRKASDENRVINQQEIDDIDDINRQRRLDEAECLRIAASQRALRTAQNKMKYRKHLIEAGNRPVIPRAQVTRRIMQNTVQMTDELQPAPILRRDGRIDVITTVDNFNGTQWTLLPDGRHIWRGNPVQYRAADSTASRPF